MRHRPDYRCEIGRAQLIRDGDDARLISTGFMTMRARSTRRMR